MSRQTPRIAELEARVEELTRERDTLIEVLGWYAASRDRWISAWALARRYISRLNDDWIREPEETLFAPFGPVHRPDLRAMPPRPRSEKAQDLDDYARDINSW